MNTPAQHPEDELIPLLKQCLALAYASKDFELHQRIHKMILRIEKVRAGALTAPRYHNGGFTGNGHFSVAALPD